MSLYQNIISNKGDKIITNFDSSSTIEPMTLIDSKNNLNAMRTESNSNLSKDKSPNKKEISALPDTGEKEKNTTIFASLLIIIGSLLLFRKNKNNV